MKLFYVLANKYHFRFYKEIVLVFFAIVSVVLVVYEVVANPSQEVIESIDDMDITIALVFLADYLWLWFRAGFSFTFFIKNLHLLLASVPLIGQTAELLRSFRVIEIIRLVRAGEHVKESYTEINHDL